MGGCRCSTPGPVQGHVSTQEGLGKQRFRGHSDKSPSLAVVEKVHGLEQQGGGFLDRIGLEGTGSLAGLGHAYEPGILG